MPDDRVECCTTVADCNDGNPCTLDTAAAPAGEEGGGVAAGGRRRVLAERGAPRPRDRAQASVTRQCFAAGAARGLAWRSRIRSISSMVAFISAIAASKGAEVVMSTPASFKRSMAYFELPDDSIFK